MMEFVIILVCFIKKYIICWADKKNAAKLPPINEEHYQPPVNHQIETLKNRKVEIQNTIEEFNTPSTFAKYSKMQRELIKIDKQMQELTSRLEAQSQVSKAQWQAKQKREKQEREAARSAYQWKSMIIRFLVNITLIRMVYSYYSYPIPFANQWPFSIIANQHGKISCSYLMVAGNLLFQF